MVYNGTIKRNKSFKSQNQIYEDNLLSKIFEYIAFLTHYLDIVFSKFWLKFNLVKYC